MELEFQKRGQPIERITRHQPREQLTASQLKYLGFAFGKVRRLERRQYLPLTKWVNRVADSATCFVAAFRFPNSF